jgi:hypothetical protein
VTSATAGAVPDGAVVVVPGAATATPDPDAVALPLPRPALSDEVEESDDDDDSACAGQWSGAMLVETGAVWLQQGSRRYRFGGNTCVLLDSGAPVTVASDDACLVDCATGIERSVGAMAQVLDVPIRLKGAAAEPILASRSLPGVLGIGCPGAAAACLVLPPGCGSGFVLLGWDFLCGAKMQLDMSRRGPAASYDAGDAGRVQVRVWHAPTPCSFAVGRAARVALLMVDDGEDIPQLISDSDSDEDEQMWLPMAAAVPADAAGAIAPAEGDAIGGRGRAGRWARGACAAAVAAGRGRGNRHGVGCGLTTAAGLTIPGGCAAAAPPSGARPHHQPALPSCQHRR